MHIEAQTLRRIIARNIREQRMRKYPGRGGAKRCAEDYGVSPQQWSPWERGTRTPSDHHLRNLAQFFQVELDDLLDPGDMRIEAENPSSPLGLDPATVSPGDCPGIPPDTSAAELLSLLFTNRVKAIYRVELSVTGLHYEKAQ